MSITVWSNSGLGIEVIPSHLCVTVKWREAYKGTGMTLVNLTADQAEQLATALLAASKKIEVPE